MQERASDTDVTRGEQYERVLQAALQLFQAKGFHATSVREIGQKARLSQSSLYYHTGSKSQILVDLNKRFMNRLVPEIQRIGEADAPAHVKVAQVIREFFRIIAAHQAEVTCLLRDRHCLPARAAKQIQLQRDEVDSIIDAIIRDGIAKGEFTKVNVPLARLALLGMVNWSSEWYRSKGALSPDALAEAFTKLILSGLVAK